MTTLAGRPAVDVHTHPDGRVLLAPSGELVHGCADALAKTLAGLPPGTSRIDLEMAAVTFMDTAAWSS